MSKTLQLLIREQILFLRKGAETERFHTVRRIHSETVGHHSFGVAWFCILLHPVQPSSDLLIAALSHDVAEHEVGDLPAPTKRQLHLREAFAQIENSFILQMSLPNPKLNEEEQRILQFADVFDGMMSCVRERQFGNQTIEICYRNFSSYAEELNPQQIEALIFEEIQQLWREAGNERE